MKGVAVPGSGLSDALNQQGGAKELFFQNLREIFVALVIVADMGGNVSALMTMKGGDNDGVSPPQTPPPLWSSTSLPI